MSNDRDNQRTGNHIFAEEKNEPVQERHRTQLGFKHIAGQKPGETYCKKNSSDIKTECPHGLIHYIEEWNPVKREMRSTIAECRHRAQDEKYSGKNGGALLPCPSQGFVDCCNADFKHGNR